MCSVTWFFSTVNFSCIPFTELETVLEGFYTAANGKSEYFAQKGDLLISLLSSNGNVKTIVQNGYS